MTSIDRLRRHRHRIDYDPQTSCYTVRIVSPGEDDLDGLPQGESKDLIAFGSTIDMAAREVLNLSRDVSFAADSET